MNWIEKENFTSKIIGIEETRSFIKKIDTNGGFASKRISLADIKYLDPVFIGWLALLGEKYNVKPELIPPKGDEFFKLSQIAFLIDNLKILTYKPVPSVSIDFSPILMINSSTFEKLFNTPFSSILEKFKIEFYNVRASFCPKFPQKKYIIRALRQILLRLYENGKLDAFSTSALFYYVESLSPIAMVRRFVDDLFGNKEWTNRPKSLGLPTTLENQANYEECGIKFLEETVIPQSQVFVYFFSLYVRNFYNIYHEKEQSKEIAEKYKNDLRELASFCMDFYLGIKELAKNIIEHSGEKPNEGEVKGEGIIVTRVYDKEKCRRFVNEIGKQSAADIYWPSDEWKGIFTAYVVDKGKKGVINTASDKLQELIDSPFYYEQIKSKLKQEKKEIDDEKITLKDFYDFYNTKNGFNLM